MKELIKKAFLFILLYLAVARCIDFVIPYYFGNPWFASKVEFLKDENGFKEYNTYFIGSSRFYRNIDPTEFDRAVNKGGNDLRSFNLGAPITFPPQSYYLYDNFLDSEESQNAKIVFLELEEIDTFGDRLHTQMSSYYVTFPNLIFVLKSVFSNYHLPLEVKLDYGYKYLVGFIENSLHLGHFSQSVLQDDYISERHVGPDKTGFFSLDDDLKDKHTKFLFDRKGELSLDTATIDVRAKAISKSFNSPSNYVDEVHLQRITKLIELSAEQGIHLVLVLEPRVGTKNVVDLYNAIPSSNKIQLSDPLEFPELYFVANSFDVGHLNLTGSKLHSKMLADLYLKLLAENSEHP